MIKSSEEAKEIIKYYKKTLPESHGSAGELMSYEAKGYLAALEGPEVKALMRQMEREIEINDHARNCLSARLRPCDCHVSRLMQALAQYYRMVKK